MKRGLTIWLLRRRFRKNAIVLQMVEEGYGEGVVLDTLVHEGAAGAVDGYLRRQLEGDAALLREFELRWDMRASTPIIVMVITYG